MTAGAGMSPGVTAARVWAVRSGRLGRVGAAVGVASFGPESSGPFRDAAYGHAFSSSRQHFRRSRIHPFIVAGVALFTLPWPSMLSISAPPIAAGGHPAAAPQRRLVRATSLLSGALVLGPASRCGAAVVLAWLKGSEARAIGVHALLLRRPPARPPGPARRASGSARRPDQRDSLRADLNISIHGLGPPGAGVGQLICTSRKTRSACGMSAV